MTTPIGHSIFAFTVNLFSGGKKTGSKQLMMAGLILFVAMAPDLDMLPILWQGYQAGISWHQGFTHSILFGLMTTSLALAVSSLFKLETFKKALLLFSSAAASHLLLDYFTKDGRVPYGIPMLWPFSEARFTSPLSIFNGFSRGSLEAIFSWHNLLVITGEIAITGALFLLVYLLLRKKKV